MNEFPTRFSFSTRKGYTGTAFTGVYSNQDLIWCVKTGGYMGFLAPSWVLINMAPGSTRTTDWWLGFGRTCPDLFHGRVARRLHSSPSCRCPDNRLGDLSERKRGYVACCKYGVCPIPPSRELNRRVRQNPLIDLILIFRDGSFCRLIYFRFILLCFFGPPPNFYVCSFFLSCLKPFFVCLLVLLKFRPVVLLSLRS